MFFGQFLEKLRNKSRKTKIIIVWSVIIPIGIVLFLLWIIILKKGANNISENIKFPEIKVNITQENEEQENSSTKNTEEENIKMIIEKMKNDEEFKKIIESLEKNSDIKNIIEEKTEE